MATSQKKEICDYPLLCVGCGQRFRAVRGEVRDFITKCSEGKSADGCLAYASARSGMRIKSFVGGKRESRLRCDAVCKVPRITSSRGGTSDLRLG